MRFPTGQRKQRAALDIHLCPQHVQLVWEGERRRESLDQTGGESADLNLLGMLGAPSSVHALDTEAEKPLDPVTRPLLVSRGVQFQ